jgi:hypothetical protein
MTALKANTKPFQTVETSLYVTATSGLTLRVKPSADASIIKIIPYGAKVFVLGDRGCYGDINIGWVSGSWLLVEYNRNKGYVFDGYLIPFEVSTSNVGQFTSEKNLVTKITEWADKEISTVTCPDTLFTDYVTEVYQENKGNSYKKIISDNYEIIELRLKDIRIMDAYFLIKNMITGEDAKLVFEENTKYYNNERKELIKIKSQVPNQILIEKNENGIICIIVKAERLRS